MIACKLDSAYLELIQEQVRKDMEAAGIVTGYSVNYDGNGNTGGLAPTDPTKYKEGETATVSGNTNGPIKAGHTFVGWNTAGDGSATVLVVGDTITIANTNISLLAVWTENPTYTVTYDGNGNDGGTAPMDETRYEQGTSVLPKSQGTLSLTGHNFIAWQDVDSNPYPAGSSFTMHNNDIVFYAVWSAESCTATFIVQGGSYPDPVSKPVTFGQLYGTLAMTSRVGYTLDGWFTDTSAGEKK